MLPNIDLVVDVTHPVQSPLLQAMMPSENPPWLNLGMLSLDRFRPYS